MMKMGRYLNIIKVYLGCIDKEIGIENERKHVDLKNEIRDKDEKEIYLENVKFLQ